LVKIEEELCAETNRGGMYLSIYNPHGRTIS
jgi:hypothetical protein